MEIKFLMWIVLQKEEKLIEVAVRERQLKIHSCLQVQA